jgi:Ctr copper transporter family
MIKFESSLLAGHERNATKVRFRGNATTKPASGLFRARTSALSILLFHTRRMRRFPLIHPATLLAATACLSRTLAQREEAIERHHQHEIVNDVDRPSSLFDAKNPHNPLSFTATDMTDRNGTSFCDNSMTMSMFVDGFHSSLLSVTSSTSSPSSSPQPATDDAGSDSSESSSSSPSSSPAPLPSCLSYLSPTFELSSPGRFALAMLASFLMAVSLEALTALKCRIVFARKRRTRRTAGEGAQPSGIASDGVPRFGPRQRRALMTLIYALQGLLGFLIMLVTMAYSVELLASVVAGLMVGNAAFGSVEAPTCCRRNSSITTPPESAVPPRIRQREMRGGEPESSLAPLLQPLLSTQNDHSYVV